MTATYKWDLNLCICLHWKRRHPWQLLKCSDSREVHQPGSPGAGMLECSNTCHRTDMESMHTTFRLHWCCSWTSWECVYLLGVGWVFAHRLLLCAAAGVPDQPRLWLWNADKGPRWHTSVTNMSPVQCRTETRPCQNHQLNIVGHLPSSASILELSRCFGIMPKIRGAIWDGDITGRAGREGLLQAEWVRLRAGRTRPWRGSLAPQTVSSVIGVSRNSWRRRHAFRVVSQRNVGRIRWDLLLVSVWAHQRFQNMRVVISPHSVF